MNLTELNNRFSIDNDASRLHFEMGKGGISIVKVENETASAVLSMQGAHLLEWIPIKSKNVIWVSEQATFAGGKSIRGGIPVCWPWFGAHKQHKNYPAHGFARTIHWQVISTRVISSGETQITFELLTNQQSNDIQAMWRWPTRVEYRVTVAKTLSLELITTNLSEETITLGQALHTYFAVDDVTTTTVTGLENKIYLDKPDGFKSVTQSGPITFNSEIDRIYLDCPGPVTIIDCERKILISKQGSHSTVVWNPGQEVALKMGDLGADGYRKMLCVESANAADDTVTISPGKSHSLQVSYDI